MDKFFIDEASSVALTKWGLFNPGFVKVAPMYFKRFEVIWKLKPEHDYGFHAYVEEKKNYIKISVKDAMSIIATIKVNRNDKEHDFGLLVSMKRKVFEEQEDFDTLIRTIVQDIMTANAFLTYGNIFDDKYVKLGSRNTNEGKVIVFREIDGEVYAAQARAHKSPEGIFSVRGHFRKYKSGKVVWIDEYLKGMN